MQDITSIVEAQEKIARLRQTRKNHEEEISKIVREVVQLQSFIVDNCPHATISKKSLYTAGGYDHRSITKTWYECTTCGKVLDTKVEYGSFQ